MNLKPRQHDAGTAARSDQPLARTATRFLRLLFLITRIFRRRFLFRPFRSAQLLRLRQLVEILQAVDLQKLLRRTVQHRSAQRLVADVGQRQTRILLERAQRDLQQPRG